MADLTAEQQARLARLLDLPDEQFTALLTAPATPAADSTTTTDGDADGLSDDELNQLLADLENDETVTDGQLVDATLSADQQAAIDLANAQNVELQQRLRVLESQAATDQWNAYATSLVSQGVPPADINLARSALLPDQAIDLSNSDSIRGRLDAMTNTIRQLLESRKGTVDLSHARGTGIDPGTPDPASGDDYWFPQFTTPTSRQEA